MRFFTAFALGAFAALAAAADNPFTMTTIPSSIPAGSPFPITWNPTTQGTVSLYLVNGPSSDVKFVSVIAANITNSGSFSWTPSNSIVNGPNYALEIVDDSNPSDVNYSGQFAISSSTNSAAVSPTSSGIASSVLSSSTAGSSSSPESSATSSSASSESSHARSKSASSESPSSSASSSSGSSPAPSSAPTSAGSGSNITSILTVPSKTITSLPTSTSGNSITATASKAAAAEQVAPVGMGLLAILGAAFLAL